MVWNWFSTPPRCPVSAETKVWIETGFSELAARLGLERLRTSKVVLPQAPLLPKSFSCTPEGVDELIQGICYYMHFDPKRVVVAYYDDAQPILETSNLPPTHNADGQVEIWLEVHALQDPVRLLADISREIGHAILIDIDPALAELPDHEERCELVAVYHGAGLFLANSALFSYNWSDGHTSGHQIEKQCYLSLDMFGYALAIYTLTQRVPNPDWERYLRPDVRNAMRLGIEYLQHTGDCQFQPCIQ